MNIVLSSRTAVQDSLTFEMGEKRVAHADVVTIADECTVNSAASWTAPAERRGDGAFGSSAAFGRQHAFGRSKSGVALRLPPHSKIAAFLHDLLVPNKSSWSTNGSLLPLGEGKDEGQVGFSARTLTPTLSRRARETVRRELPFRVVRVFRGDSFVARRAFSLVEILVVVSLLSLIVLVLMTVFNSTQKAFRAGVTQTDVLEGSRAAMDLLVSDLKLMSPCDGPTNNYDGVNFFAGLNPLNYYLPFIQTLPGSGLQRTNVIENAFWLSRQNLNGHDSWVGIGYTVQATSVSPLFPLYRFYTNAPASTDPLFLYNTFTNSIWASAFTSNGWSHLVDGVVDFRLQPYDVNGYAMTNSSQFNSGLPVSYPSTAFALPPAYGVTAFYFLSNAIPASVEIQMSTLEDAVLRRADSFGGFSLSQSNYLAQQVGRTHVFRQRVLLPNVDPNAYP